MDIFAQAKRLKQLLASVAVTLTITILVLAAGIFPGFAEVLQFDRPAIAAGEVWRLVTCHLTHWNADHLRWDLLMFVVLGVACELRSSTRLRVCLIAAIGAVSTTVALGFPEIHTYRGLSGIDSALFTLLAIDLLREAVRDRNLKQIALQGGLLIGFAAKIAYEATTGETFFVDREIADFSTLIYDHLAGAVVGLIVAVADTRLGIVKSPVVISP